MRDLIIVILVIAIFGVGVILWPVGIVALIIFIRHLILSKKTTV
jgi:hypothetical protein